MTIHIAQYRSGIDVWFENGSRDHVYDFRDRGKRDPTNARERIARFYDVPESDVVIVVAPRLPPKRRKTK